MLFVLKETAQQRYAICKSCEYLSLNFCTDCKCFVPAKVRFANTECPQKKWLQGEPATSDEYPLDGEHHG